MEHAKTRYVVLMPILAFMLLFGLLYWPMWYLQESVPQAHADSLTFGPLPNVAIPLPSGLWQLPDGPPYKNDRLALYQHLLIDRGITDRNELRLLTANILIENGALAGNIDGDHGCSVGIPMRNVCQFGYTAKSFRRKYPEWNDYRFQLTWMADRMVENIQHYRDIRLAIISHNSPAAANRGQDSCGISPCYFQRVQIQANLLSS